MSLTNQRDCDHIWGPGPGYRCTECDLSFAEWDERRAFLAGEPPPERMPPYWPGKQERYEARVRRRLLKRGRS